MYAAHTDAPNPIDAHNSASRAWPLVILEPFVPQTPAIRRHHRGSAKGRGRGHWTGTAADGIAAETGISAVCWKIAPRLSLAK